MSKRDLDPASLEGLMPITWVRGDHWNFKLLVERCAAERGYRPVAAGSKWAPAGQDGTWFPTAWVADLDWRSAPQKRLVD